MASRTEGLTKFYHVVTLITEYTFNELNGQFITRNVDLILGEIDCVVVTGKSVGVKLYELVARATDVLPESRVNALAMYNEGLNLYKQRRFEEAALTFEKAVELYNDGPSQVLGPRCREYMDFPPPFGWNGVYVAQGK